MEVPDVPPQVPYTETPKRTRAMSKEQTPPLVSDERILNDVKLTVRATPNRTMEVKDLPLTAFQVRDIYEADRQKTREVVQANRKLIQSWVDALGDALKSFESAGYTPTPKP